MEKGSNYFIVRPDLPVHFIKNSFLLVLILFIAIIAGALALLGTISNAYLAQISLFFIITLILLAVSAFYSILFCRSTTVTLESNQMIYQTGILRSKRKIISLDSIIDTSLERGVFDKLFNVARLNVSTAGSRSYEASISNVKYEPANEIHERIHEKIRAHRKESITRQA